MASPFSVPRWTPSPSPTRPLRPVVVEEDDIEMHGLRTGVDAPGGIDRSFPFSTGTFDPPPHVHPRFHHDSREEIEGLPEMDVVKTSFKEKVPSLGMVGHEDLEISNHTNNLGVFLTWEDLWVSASDGKGGRVPILRGLNGYARPAEVLAIMGPSGCGKSTLLDTLAGRLGSNVGQRGEILINGQKQKLAFGTSGLNYFSSGHWINSRAFFDIPSNESYKLFLFFFIFLIIIGTVNPHWIGGIIRTDVIPDDYQKGQILISDQ